MVGNGGERMVGNESKQFTVPEVEGYITYQPSVFTEQQCKYWFERLIKEAEFQRTKTWIGGVVQTCKRSDVNAGCDYDFNKGSRPTVGWPAWAVELVAAISANTGERYNNALVNLYPDGEAGIGPHRDKRNPEVIDTLSLGATRFYGVSKIGFTTLKPLLLPLDNGSLLHLPGAVNEQCKHWIMTGTGQKHRAIGPRISVTLRRLPGCDHWPPVPSAATSAILVGGTGVEPV